MNYTKYLPKFAVVEINRSFGLDNAHVISADRLTAANWFDTVPTEEKDLYIENGAILYLDIDGELKAPGKCNAAIKGFGRALLHFTEELIGNNGATLDTFAVDFDQDKEAYPRTVALYVGDEFTTDRFEGTLPTAGTTAVGYVDANGMLQVVANTTAITAGYVGPLFNVKAGTTPDAEKEAGIFMTVSERYTK